MATEPVLPITDVAGAVGMTFHSSLATFQAYALVALFPGLVALGSEQQDGRLAWLRSVVTIQRELLQNVCLRTCTEMTSGPSDAVKYSLVDLQSDGFRFVCYKCLSEIKEDCNGRSGTIVMFDGKRAITHTAGANAAFLFDRREDISDVFALSSDHYFAAMCWDPSRALTAQPPREFDLLSVLSSPGARVRPEDDFINGNLCWVVERDSEGTKARDTWWLAVNSGALPIRHEHVAKDGTLAIVYAASDVMRLPNGAFLLAKASVSVAPMPGLDAPDGIEFELRLESSPDGVVAASSWNGPGDDFEFDKNLPEGTVIVGTNRKPLRVVQGADPIRTADRFVASELTPSAGLYITNDDAQHFSAIRWTSMIVAGGVGLAGGYAWRRSR